MYIPTYLTIWTMLELAEGIVESRLRRLEKLAMAVGIVLRLTLTTYSTCPRVRLSV